MAPSPNFVSCARDGRHYRSIPTALLFRCLRLGGCQYPAEHAIDHQHPAVERACSRSALCSTALRRSRSPRTWPCWSSTSIYVLRRRRRLRLRRCRTPRPRCFGRHCRSIWWARNDCCRSLWMRRLCRARGSLASCAGRKELVETRSSIHLTITVALSRKGLTRATCFIKAAVAKVLAKRK